MTPNEFLNNELENISKDFPQVNIRYGYNSLIKSYIVELLPIEEYYNNTKLDDTWIPLSFKFREHFPTEEIAFISSDSELRLKVILGEFNVDISSFDMINQLFEPLTKNEINLSFPTSMANVGHIVSYSFVGLLKYPKQKVINDLSEEFVYEQAA